MTRRRSSPPKSEPRYKSGEVRLSEYHFALLLGLFDRPSEGVRSYTDWIAAAMPYVRQFSRVPTEAMLERSIDTIHPDWVTKQRHGRFGIYVIVTLTPRGRAIVEREVPARIIGRGPRAALPSMISEALPPVPFVLEPPSRPAGLPSLDVQGFDLDFRPSEYPHEVTTIALFMIPDITATPVCFVTTRVGRAYRLSIESQLEMRNYIQAARDVLTMHEVIEFIDGAEREGFKTPWRTHVTLFDSFICHWAKYLGVTQAREDLANVSVESTIYPELQAYYAARFALWDELLQQHERNGTCP